MGADATRNADALARVLAAERAELPKLGSDEQRERHADALELMEGYAQLLREPPGVVGAPARDDRYLFKLVFPDGSWSVDEKQLPEPPRDGDVLLFEGSGRWLVRGTQRVMSRPAGKPARELLICSPVA